MTDLNRLLELAEKVVPTPGVDQWWDVEGLIDEDAVRVSSEEAEYIVAASPDTIIGLIERVKEAERDREYANNAITAAAKVQRELETRLQAAEEVVIEARAIRQMVPEGFTNCQGWKCRQRNCEGCWTDPEPYDTGGFDKALQHYDEVVKG